MKHNDAIDREISCNEMYSKYGRASNLMFTIFKPKFQHSLTNAQTISNQPDLDNMSEDSEDHKNSVDMLLKEGESFDSIDKIDVKAHKIGFGSRLKKKNRRNVV